MSERELLHLEGIPVYQNKMFHAAREARACPTGDLVLVQDENSGLIYNRSFDQEKMSYDGSYQNEQGHSLTFQRHVREVLAKIDFHFKSMSILEIGCGKGAFLELLRAADHNAIGIDPAYEGNSEHVIAKHFEPGLGIRGDAIIMRHTLEHIPSPLDFLEMVRTANGGSGRIYIEVPSLEWILMHNAWFDVFYEHVNYFRVADFDRIFGRVIESGTVFGGQYIYVIAELDSLQNPSASYLETPTPVTIPTNFFASLDRCAQVARAGAHSAIWGAAAKGVMFAHHMKTRDVTPALAIDINPAKQGCFLAGSGLSVLAPSTALKQLGNAPDIFVMNSNYLSEIRAMGGPQPNYFAADQI